MTLQLKKKTPDSEERCEVSHLSLNWAEQIMIASFRSWMNNPTVWICREKTEKNMMVILCLLDLS